MSKIQITTTSVVLLGVLSASFLAYNTFAPDPLPEAMQSIEQGADFQCFNSGSFCFNLPEEFFDLDKSADPLKGISLKSHDGSIYLKLREYANPTNSLRSLFDTKYQSIQSSTKVFYVGKVYLNDQVDQLSAEFALNNIYYYYLVKDLGPTIVEIVIFGADQGREAVLKAAMGLNIYQKMASARI